MIALLLAHAFAADKSAQCEVDKKTVVFQDADFTGRKGSRGLVHPIGLSADLGEGLVGELRYEHAYGATFAILAIRRGDETVAEATTWMSVEFDHTTNGAPDPKNGALPISAVSLQAKVGARTFACHANFL